MRDAMKKVKEFMTAANKPMPAKPTVPTTDDVYLGMKLLREEYTELQDALYKVTDIEGMVAVADELADLVYVICHNAHIWGIPLDRVFDEVHRSNMTKFPGEQPIYNEDGKVVKPPSYSPPRILRILRPVTKNSENV